MSHFFAPAERLSSHLTFRWKLIGSFLLFAVPLAIAITVIAWTNWKDVQVLSEQRQALAGQVVALRAVAALQARQSAAVLAQDVADANSVLAESSRTLADRVRTLRGQPFYAAEDLALVDKALQSLVTAGSGSDLWALHADLREAIQLSRAHAAERSGLLRTDDEVARLLVESLTGLAPKLINLFGDARERGLAAVLAKRVRGRDRNELTLVRSGIDPLMTWTRENFDQILKQLPDRRSALDEAFDAINAPRLGLQEYLTTKVLDSTDFDVSPSRIPAEGNAGHRWSAGLFRATDSGD